jgi:Nucleotide-diphospho-sugar transferase
MTTCGYISARRVSLIVLLLLVIPLFVFQLFLAFNNPNGSGATTGSIDRAVLPQHLHVLTDAVAALYDNISIISSSNKNQSAALPIVASSYDVKNNNNSSSSRLIKSQTKIVAICDSLYKEIAPFWYHRLTRVLGYDNAVVIAVDNATADYLQQRQVPFERLADSARSCSKFHAHIAGPKGKQQYRRTIFGMRYLYVLHQLERGHHVLLADIDNNFIRYMPMSVMEQSDYDVYHAYGDAYPVDIYQALGFTVCGGMAWFRASPASIRFVKQILRHCGIKDYDDALSEKCSVCDDQRKINMLLLRAYRDSVAQRHNTTKWNIPPHTLDRNVFWKRSITGQWGVTGHTFTIWDVDTAYRGRFPTNDSECPGGHLRQQQQQEQDRHSSPRASSTAITMNNHMNWVAMPTTMDRRQKYNLVQDRKLRLRGWYERCERDKILELDDFKLLPVG